MFVLIASMLLAAQDAGGGQPEIVEEFQSEEEIFVEKDFAVEMGGNATMVLRPVEGGFNLVVLDTVPPTDALFEFIESLAGHGEAAMGENSAAIALDHRDFPPPQERSITFMLYSLGGDTLLVMSNGTQDVYEYRAEMIIGENRQHTDVCQLLPGKYGFEHWPHDMDAIFLSDFQQGEAAEDGKPVCR